MPLRCLLMRGTAYAMCCTRGWSFEQSKTALPMACQVSQSCGHQQLLNNCQQQGFLDNSTLQVLCPLSAAASTHPLLGHIATAYNRRAGLGRAASLPFINQVLAAGLPLGRTLESAQRSFRGATEPHYVSDSILVGKKVFLAAK